VTASKLEWALLGTAAVTTFDARRAAEESASPAAEKSAAEVGSAEIRELIRKLIRKQCCSV
jgi:hypothetical protein